MIYYCVKTEEYLSEITKLVNHNAEYYMQFDIAMDKARKVFDKLNARYFIDQNANQRHYRLKSMPVVDLVILYNQSLRSVNKLRFCLLVSMNLENRNLKDPKRCRKIIIQYYQCKNDQDQFLCLNDRKTRLIYRAASGYLNIYELVKTTYTKAQRKKYEVVKTESFSFRLHQDFYKAKENDLEAAFKNAQKLKDIEKQNQQIQQVNDQIALLYPTRLIRQQLFDLRHHNFKWSHRYLNRAFTGELKPLKKTHFKKRLVNSWDEMIEFTQQIRA